MDALLKTQIFVDVFLIEEYEYAALRKELLIFHFIEPWIWASLTYFFVSTWTNLLKHCFFTNFYQLL